MEKGKIGRKRVLTLQHPQRGASKSNLLLPGSGAKDERVVSLLAAGTCRQRGGRAVTPSGPATQQQMGPQHHLGVSSGSGGVLSWEVGAGCWSGLCFCSLAQGLALLKGRGIKVFASTGRPLEGCSAAIAPLM